MKISCYYNARISSCGITRNTHTALERWVAHSFTTSTPRVVQRHSNLRGAPSCPSDAAPPSEVRRLKYAAKKLAAHSRWTHVHVSMQGSHRHQHGPPPRRPRFRPPRALLVSAKVSSSAFVSAFSSAAASSAVPVPSPQAELALRLPLRVAVLPRHLRSLLQMPILLHPLTAARLV